MYLKLVERKGNGSKMIFLVFHSFLCLVLDLGGEQTSKGKKKIGSEITRNMDIKMKEVEFFLLKNKT